MYEPSKHTESNKSYAPSQGNPADARAYYYDDGNKVQRVYQSKKEVLGEITGVDRRGHSLFVINTGGTITGGSLTGGINELYYFKDGYGDDNLVKLIPPPVDFQETPLHATDSTTIKFTQLGTKGHDLSAAVKIAGLLSAKTGNTLVEDGGLFVPPPATPPTPPVYTADNGLSRPTATNFQLGGSLTHDTAISGGAKMAFLNGRVGIGMNPVFPLDIYNNWANLGAQISNVMTLANGQARLGMLSAMQLFGGEFTHSAIDQVSGTTGQLVFYNAGKHILNPISNYTGQAGIFIGFATAPVSNGVPSAMAAMSFFGKNGSYTEAAGIRVSMPVGSGFPDAADFSGVIGDFYGVLLEKFNPNTFPKGTIDQIWGFYQKGNEPNRLGGKIVFDATLNAGNGNVTINKPAGTFTIPAGQKVTTVTNNLVTVDSIVYAQLKMTDGVATSCIVMEGIGAFTITLNATPTAPLGVKFIVYN